MTLKLTTLLTSLAITLGFSSVNAQSICLGNDTTVCQGSPVTVQDCNPNNNSAGTVLTNGTLINLSDDSYSPVVPIGFSFDYYGNTFTQCVIGSNGVVTFDLSEANGYCPWSLGAVAPLPNPGFDDALNAQMPAYHDMNPSAFASPGGEIMYETVGVAPNRQFIVLWSNIMAFGGGGECSYMALVMNETANSFEFHLGYKPIAGGWNGGLAIQGSQNAGGTSAHITPGRNNQQWSAIADSRIWVPDAPNNTMNYTITQIPYVLFLSPNAQYQWGDTNGNSWPYNNGVLVLAQTLPGITGYFLTVSGSQCSNSVGGASDTTFITSASASATASAIDDICSSSVGEVTANPISGPGPYIYNWPTLGNDPNQTVTGVPAGNYLVQVWDGMGCMTTANVIVGDTPAAFQGSTTIVSCPGGNDGTAFAEMVPALGNITYQWDAAAGNQTTQTAVGLIAGQYTCTITSDVGCSGIVVVDVTEIPGMIGVISNQTDVTCNSGFDGMMELTVIQGTGPYGYFWDHSASTTNIATDLGVGPHSCIVTDANGCTITINGVLGEPAPLDITFLTPDTQICPEEDIELSVTGTGGSSLHLFTWFENGVEIGTGGTITVDPDVTNTTYCVELSELCGSPTDQECVLIYFPTPIQPSAIPDETEKCVPNSFIFTHSSTNAAEIATTYWEFGDNPTHNAITQGADTVSHYYTAIGTHDIIMTVTSIYGCVYTDTMFSLIEVLPSPVADFNFSSNPTTIFETVILMQNNSSFDVIDWQWISPDSNPTYSSATNPVFEFPEEVAQYPVTLIVTTEHGCTDTLTLILDVVDDILFYAPNSFTPDGDEFNQTWEFSVLGIDIYDFELFIFDRWGEVIWESHDPTVGWDGTYKGRIVEAGTYQWIARVKSPYDDNKKIFNGSISILR
ncbi:MAG: gliding motility-associated C-terminal domain-containing protein [Crocinitomicaceae bacterium]|nr:gliding motility-associated C-terminal domain-containing protein [Crocinitomicaceae bacterium]